MSNLVDAQPRRRLFFIGNPGRGDDGVAIALLDQLTQLPCWQAYAGYVAAEWYFQLCPEQIYELNDVAAVLFIDADASGSDEVHIEPLTPDQHCTIDSHSLPPTTLLRLYEDIFKQQAPKAWLLRIGGNHFALTHSLSPVAQANLHPALHHLLAWLDATLSSLSDDTTSSSDSFASVSKSGKSSVTGVS